MTSEAIDAAQLREALPGETAPEETEVMVVAPALQESALRFWMSDADEAIAKADQVRRDTVEKLGDEGVSASGDVGESDPSNAIQDALQTFDADRILVFTHADSDAAYREDVDDRELEERFGVPVERVGLRAE